MELIAVEFEDIKAGDVIISAGVKDYTVSGHKVVEVTDQDVIVEGGLDVAPNCHEQWIVFR